jgi:Phytanoyl-CoA dioxygenase (PhyH)
VQRRRLGVSTAPIGARPSHQGKPGGDGAARGYRGRVDELADSSALVDEQDALRRRLAADGYLFFRGLLPVREIEAAGASVAERLRSGGWVDDRGTPSATPRAVNPKDALADPAFLAAVTGAAFNRIPYLPPLRSVARLILGPQAFSYPVKVLRAVYPERPGARARGRYVHHDYAVSGVQDMLTSWIPLMEIPVRLGGLAVRPGGHLGPPHPPRVLSPADAGWATTCYRPGDVIIFHCLTPHAALPNAGSALRLSGDFRWQLADRPAPAELVLGPAGRPWELFSRMFRRERWWQPVPAGLTLRPRMQLVTAPPGPSQFFAVHPGWQHWRPPPAAVH